MCIYLCPITHRKNSFNKSLTFHEPRKCICECNSVESIKIRNMMRTDDFIEVKESDGFSTYRWKDFEKAKKWTISYFGTVIPNKTEEVK